MAQSFTFHYPADTPLYTTDTAGRVQFESSFPAKIVFTLTQESDKGYFTIGDQLSMSASFDGGEPMTQDVIVVGISANGLLLMSVESQITSYLTTDLNERYDIDDVIQMSTIPGTEFPVCFVRGTLIETPRGPVAIEDLQAGDQVLGKSGVRTVKWVGWRHYGPFSLQAPEQKARCAPVRISKDALADNQPTRDLLVSPWHHLYVDGVLIRANDLVNGITITQEQHVTAVSYYHVELDQFDVVIAHGVYSESWADGGNRDFFQNADVTTLRPEDRQRRRAERPGFKVVRKQAELDRLQAIYAARANDLELSAASASKVA